MKQNKVGYAHTTVINIYIVYNLKNRSLNNLDLTAQNGLFGAAKITKDINTSNYKYSGYGICFDGNSDFSFGNARGKHVIILGADMSSFGADYTGRNSIYVLGKGEIQGFSTDGGGHAIYKK